MVIRKAVISDADRVSEIFSLCRMGMKNASIDQWQTGTPNRETFLADLNNGVALVGEENGTVFAYAALILGHDHTYDVIREGEWKTNLNEYGTLHRVAVHPDFRNKGAASKYMRYCEKICRENGIKSARIDTHRDNLGMQHTILKNGYEYCGIITIDDGTERFAYEKIIND